jgi:hypothetical protein
LTVRKPRGRNSKKLPDGDGGDPRPAVAPDVIEIPFRERLAFRIDEFAALLGISKVTVYRGIKLGDIETVMQNGVRLIPRRYLVKAGYIDEPRP